MPQAGAWSTRVPPFSPGEAPSSLGSSTQSVQGGPLQEAGGRQLSLPDTFYHTDVLSDSRSRVMGETGNLRDVKCPSF